MRCAAMRGDISWTSSRACAIAILICTIAASDAGPVDRTSRMVGDTVPLDSNFTSGQMGEACAVGDVVYMPGDTVPGSIPCEMCLCGPSGRVQCEPIECEPKSGCKALHRPDHCCPLYQCECEHNGRTYANGEKQIDPIDPCRVCYCQGGNIICNRLACFHRDDCDPRFVAGRCCPEYDHCPPRDLKSDVRVADNSSSFTTKPHFSLDLSTDDGNSLKHSSEPFENKRDIEAKESKTAEISQSISPKVNEIRIKEVTQKMEIPADTGIRIKEVHPLINREINQYNIDSTKAPLIQREVEYSTATPSNESNVTGSGPKLVQNKSSSPAYPSPPVIRIGDQLVFLKLGDLAQEPDSLSTPSTVITVFGAEGLVQGEEEELVENETIHDNDYKETIINSSDKTILSVENKLPNKTSTLNALRNISLSSSTQIDSITPVSKPSEVTVTESNQYTKEVEKDSKMALGITLGSLTTALSESSTEKVSSASANHAFEHILELNPEYPTITDYSETEYTTETSTDGKQSPTTTRISVLQQRNYENKMIVKRPVLTIPNQKSISDENKQSKILPDVLQFKNDNASRFNKSSVVSTLTPKEWLKTSKPANSSINKESVLLNLESSLPDEIPNSTSSPDQKEAEHNEDIDKNEHDDGLVEPNGFLIELRSPGEPLLIPEWERNVTSDKSIAITTSSGDDEETEKNFSKTRTFQPPTTNITKDNYFTTESFTETSIANTDGSSIQYFDINTPVDNDKPQTYDLYNDTYKIEVHHGYNTTETEIELPKQKEDVTLNTIYISSTTQPQDEQKTTDDIKEKNIIKTTAVSEEAFEGSLSSDESNDKAKNKSNILADLISLVGDVAAMGDHNDQDISMKKHEVKLTSINNPNKNNIKINEPVTKLTITEIPAKIKYDQRNVELSDLTPLDDHDLPSENKVEPITEKPIIDKVSHTNHNQSLTETHDIEIFPKVENNTTFNKKEPKKIIEDPAVHDRAAKLTSEINTTDNLRFGQDSTTTKNEDDTEIIAEYYIEESI